MRVKARLRVFCLGPEGGVVACQATRSRPPRTYDIPQFRQRVSRFLSDTMHKNTHSDTRVLNNVISIHINDAFM